MGQTTLFLFFPSLCRAELELNHHRMLVSPPPSVSCSMPLSPKCASPSSSMTTMAPSSMLVVAGSKERGYV
uniref:Secreted protein n=1 Tax=Oryza sativa subsp. japonica TaxID=39947 RepID=Q6ERW3_ORYSJ|nr:hypothetical protein [Oryza sativa Japonica Group]BAD28607.1 hypothetical protein [Oryza sativa Japonica Group]